MQTLTHIHTDAQTCIHAHNNKDTHIRRHVQNLCALVPSMYMYVRTYVCTYMHTCNKLYICGGLVQREDSIHLLFQNVNIVMVSKVPYVRIRVCTHPHMHCCVHVCIQRFINLMRACTVKYSVHTHDVWGKRREVGVCM